MSTKRPLQISEVIRAELGKLFLTKLEFPRDILVTITNIETSADLSQTKVGISVLPWERRMEAFSLVMKKKSELQHLLNQKLILRLAPKLIFYLDNTEEKASAVEKLLDYALHEK